MIGVIGLIIGIVLGVLLDPTVPAWLAPFLPDAVVAGLLVFLGTQLGVGSAMTTAVVVVLGIRIFSNTASIRRLLLKA